MNNLKIGETIYLQGVYRCVITGLDGHIIQYTAYQGTTDGKPKKLSGHVDLFSRMRLNAKQWDAFCAKEDAR